PFSSGAPDAPLPASNWSSLPTGAKKTLPAVTGLPLKVILPRTSPKLPPQPVRLRVMHKASVGLIQVQCTARSPRGTVVSGSCQGHVRVMSRQCDNFAISLAAHELQHLQIDRIDDEAHGAVAHHEVGAAGVEAAEALAAHVRKIRIAHVDGARTAGARAA